MALKLLFLVPFIFLFTNLSEKGNNYYKDFYETGKTKSEGWLRYGAKTGYWKFYHT